MQPVKRYCMVNPVVCLMGPTASGKTDLACRLVEAFAFEIISVDSAMIYRGMDIGTAKPDNDVLFKAPHHLIDILDPIESYSAAQFCTDVDALCDDIKARGKIPLLVGGTMMYFRALQQGLSPLPDANEALRASLLMQAARSGWPALHKRLAEIDSVTAARVHPHDSQRIQRALEVYELSGKPLSAFFDSTTANPSRQYINLILMPEDRAWLHLRIAHRFAEMLDLGFLDEVAALRKRWPLTLAHPAMRSVGYRQAMLYLNGDIDFDTFNAKSMAATRQLAKRQLTWLRHWPDAHRFTAENSAVASEVMAIIYKMLDNNGNRIEE